MKLKFLSILSLVILLTGCGENTIIECKQMGFKSGIKSGVAENH